MTTQTGLFGDIRPVSRSRPAARKPPPVNIEAPLWTIDKSRLDLFAGPQHTTDTQNWSVRRVLERRTQGNPAIRHYTVCDIKRKQAARLRRLGKNHASFRVYEGDANEHVHEMLREAPITPKTACFCLIDQRTFECHWTTVEAVAQYKREGYKIELFYFLAQRWLDRAWASTRNANKLAAWWGNGDHKHFRTLRSVERAVALCDRFRDELGYAYSVPFSIHEKGEGSRTMYYMIHASESSRRRWSYGKSIPASSTRGGRGPVEVQVVKLWRIEPPLAGPGSPFSGDRDRGFPPSGFPPTWAF